MALCPIDTILTVTLTQENAEALKDFEFWTGESRQSILNMAFAEFMEPIGNGHLWDIARDPNTRMAAFKRNKLTERQIASRNTRLEAELEQLRTDTAVLI